MGAHRTFLQKYPLANLGIRTDLAIQELTGLVVKKSPFIIARTPQAPEYFFGNMLVLSSRPTANSLKFLESAFYDEFSADYRIRHRAFTWPDGQAKLRGLEKYVDAGYNVSHNCVLVLDRYCFTDTTTQPEITIRTFRDDGDWDTWLSMHISDGGQSDDNGRQRRFLEHRATAYKHLIARGLGDWWGAYIEDVQVASAGLFFVDGFGRFQSVLTDVKYRNRGICRRLLSVVTRAALTRVERLIIVSDMEHHAGLIYQSLGFKQYQWIGSLCHDGS